MLLQREEEGYTSGRKRRHEKEREEEDMMQTQRRSTLWSFSCDLHLIIEYEGVPFKTEASGESSYFKRLMRMSSGTWLWSWILILTKRSLSLSFLVILSQDYRHDHCLWKNAWNLSALLLKEITDRNHTPSICSVLPSLFLEMKEMNRRYFFWGIRLFFPSS